MLRHVQSPDGVPIADEVGGQGPGLVLVHGAGAGRWGFDLVRPLLEASFHRHRHRPPRTRRLGRR
ncbi:MAG TPA: hypothetical protein VES62_13510 [Thermoleophilaceae bacterium]|nr:hypothetical protein [Thermoleophilaceae bacterium]